MERTELAYNAFYCGWESAHKEFEARLRETGKRVQSNVIALHPNARLDPELFAIIDRSVLELIDGEPLSHPPARSKDKRRNGDDLVAA